MWFEELTGFKELSTEYVRERLEVHDLFFVFKGDQHYFGSLQIPTLESLRATITNHTNHQTKIREVVADVQSLHADPQNAGALFQVASQFNLLEMISPNVTPEHGIDRYERDLTQGPACAIACGAGTIYRQYCAPLDNQVGQSSDHQIDCLDLIGDALGNDAQKLWQMKNGYALPTKESIKAINLKLLTMSDDEREALKGLLKVGVQWDTQVTISPNAHLVNQVFCAAMPVSYTNIDHLVWEPFARLILEATYEATLYLALHNLQRGQSNKVFLTLVGGGAFGNEETWVLDALAQAVRKFAGTPLDISVVSYRRSNTELKKMLDSITM